MISTPASVKTDQEEKSDNEEDGEGEDSEEDEMEIDGTVSNEIKDECRCLWHSEDGKPCSEDFLDREKLFNHLKDIHLPESMSRFTCMWRGCRRIVNSSRRDQIIQHIGIHLLELSKRKVNGAVPQTPKSIPAPTPNSQNSHTSQGLHSSVSGLARPGMASMNPGFSGGHPSHIYPEINDELRGIPLTALLVLRNLARHPDNRRLYYPFEQTLASLVAQPRFSKLASSILAEL
jgi:hypothetical protein